MTARLELYFNLFLPLLGALPVVAARHEAA